MKYTRSPQPFQTIYNGYILVGKKKHKIHSEHSEDIFVIGDVILTKKEAQEILKKLEAFIEAPQSENETFLELK